VPVPLRLIRAATGDARRAATGDAVASPRAMPSHRHGRCRRIDEIFVM
jgi:hypothetical protein